MDFKTDVLPLYNELKKVFKANAKSDEVTALLKRLYEVTYEFITSCEDKEWISKVEGKEYFSFVYNGNCTRAINRELFAEGRVTAEYSIDGENIFLKPADYLFINVCNKRITEQNAHEITVAIYSIAISFCATIDLLKKNDQKTPGTYFEMLMGHFYARTFDINPRKQLDVLNLGSRATLPTDFIFDLGDMKPKYHIPVKTSTRERVVQVWSHQKVLDGVYGVGRFLGLLTCLAETNVNTGRNDVTEVCLPDQWQIYQLFIARLTRIYYLDIPNKYKELNYIFPRIHVKEFGEFFYEVEQLAE